VPLYQETMKLLDRLTEYDVEFWRRINSEREFGH